MKKTDTLPPADLSQLLETSDSRIKDFNRHLEKCRQHKEQLQKVLTRLQHNLDENAALIVRSRLKF